MTDEMENVIEQIKMLLKASGVDIEGYSVFEVNCYHTFMFKKEYPNGSFEGVIVSKAGALPKYFVKQKTLDSDRFEARKDIEFNYKQFLNSNPQQRLF